MFAQACVLSGLLLVGSGMHSPESVQTGSDVIATVWHIDANQLILVLPNDQLERLEIVPETVVLVNGVEAAIEEVHPGFLATVMFEDRDGRPIVKLIDARMQPH
jgi:hypothetical protein